MDISLDEYIAKEKINSSNYQNYNRADKNRESKFKAERHENDEDLEDDDMTGDNSVRTVGIWKGPNSDTNYLDLDYVQDEFEDALNGPELKTQINTKKRNLIKYGITENQPEARFDLREKITGNIVGNSNLPHMQSKQWRLMQPNVGSNRPAGIPPLVPQNSPLFTNRHQQQHWSNNQNQNNQRWGKNNGRNAKQRNGNWSNQNNNRNGSKNNNNNNHGRIQRQNPRCTQDMNNKKLKIVVDHLAQSSSCDSSYPTATDLTIECPSETIGLPTNSQIRSDSMFNVGKQTAEAAAVRTNNLQLQNVNNVYRGNESIKTLLGIGDQVRTEMIPSVAVKILDILHNGVQSAIQAPKYDMKIQKEIHDIQKKPLMYKCPSGEVVSSDGAGINNCHITPRTSGVSLNCRFG